MKAVKGCRYLYRRGGSFIFRRGVPEYASQEFHGKGEAFETLEAKTLDEAKFEILGEIRRFNQLIAIAKKRNRSVIEEVASEAPPTMAEVEEGVREWFAARVDKGNTEAARQHVDVNAARARELELTVYAATVQQNLGLAGDDNDLTGHWISQTLIERHRWAVEKGTPEYQRLLRTVRRAQIQSAKMELQELRGEPRSVEDETFSAEQFRLDSERKLARVQASPIRIMDLFDGYVQENKLKPDTVTAWRKQIAAFIEFLGHDNARAVEHLHLVAWKEHLLKQRTRTGSLLNPRTVRDTYFAAVKAVFRWAKGNAKIEVNPTSDIQIRVTKRRRTREAGFTDGEALKILRATMEPSSKKLTPERAFARRWVPWLCAYSGARIREITQLRREDVVKINEIWIMNITPEAGSVKTDEARIVPLHPHLIAQGFISEIERKKGPLFYDPSRRQRHDTEQSSQSRKVGDYLAKWVRTTGVNDRAVQPNHGWRHRFKTLARRHGMDPEKRDFIQGHAPRTEGEGYGDSDVEGKYTEILKLPPYEVSK